MRIPTDAFTQGCIDGILTGRLFWQHTQTDTDEHGDSYAVIALWEPDPPGLDEVES